MAIAIAFNRPKLNTTLTVNESLETKTVSESSNKFRLPVCIDTVTQDSIALTGLSWTTGSDVVTGSEGAFSAVRLGDVFIGSGGDGVDFASDTYVIAKPSTTTIQLSTNALTTESATTGTIAAKIIDATVYIVETTNAINGSNLNVTVKIFTMDGTKVFDSANSTDYDNATVTDGTEVTLGSATINLDTFFSSARVARTDS